MKKILTLALLVMLFASLAVMVHAEDTFTNPVAPLADPFIFKEGDTYYLYGTGGSGGYLVYTSENLVEWTARGYCLVKADIPYDMYNPNENGFWAPEVFKYGGKYYMIYTCQHRLGVAVADSPLGPFKDDAETYLIRNIATIDGHLFEDNGKVYLYFATEKSKNDNSKILLNNIEIPKGNNIWGCEFDMETLSMKTETIKLIMPADGKLDYTDGTTGPKVEGPYILKHDGKFYLTFSSGGYWTPKYAVHYAVSDSPLGDFTRDTENFVLACDDLDYSDNRNPHLYGSGHHSFTTAPNGKDLVIVYHSHRTGFSYSASSDNLYNPRPTCLDLAWFDSNGVLRAGSKDNPGVPTAVEQPMFEGSSRERQQYLTGTFAKLSELPRIYVASMDGSDDNPGTKDAPVKTISKALSFMPKGGTIVFTQRYNTTHLDLSALRGPLMFTAENNHVTFSFKYISVHSAVYFDNLVLMPTVTDEIPVIECNFNNVVFGEGISCHNSPERLEYPYIVGGRWNYSGTLTTDLYNKFKYTEDKLSSTKAYTVTVLGGTWSLVEKGSLDYKTPVGTAEKGVLVTDNSGLTPTEPVTPPVAEKTVVKMTIDSLTAFVNGTAKTLDAAPIIRNSRTMLPVRFVAENLGATVGWDDATKTVSVKSADTTIEIVIGATTAKVNGKEITLDSPAFIENSRTYLPVRVVAENLGAEVAWDDATKTATLTK